MKKNITLIRGDVQTICLAVMDEDRASAIQSTDTVYFTAKPKYDNDSTDSTAVISKTKAASEVINPDGTITLKLESSDMNVSPGKYVYDLVLKQSDYDRVTLLYGKLTIKPATTLRGYSS